MQTSPKYGTVFPDYCPADLREDEVCPRCGADARVTSHYCRALHGIERRSILDFVLVDKRTGEVVASRPVLWT